MICLSVFNFKGGAAKTTTAVNLAGYFASVGHSTLIVDLDGQRGSSFYLKADGKSPTSVDWLLGEACSPLPTKMANLTIIPGDIRQYQIAVEPGEDIFSPALARLEKYDFCLFDCPPGLSIAASQAILCCDRILMPVVCQTLTVKGLAEAIYLIRNQKLQSTIDVVRVRHRKNLTEYQQGEQIVINSQEESDFNLLKTIVPENTDVSKAVNSGMSVIEAFPRSAGAKAYAQLGDEYLQLILSSVEPRA